MIPLGRLAFWTGLGIVIASHVAILAGMMTLLGKTHAWANLAGAALILYAHYNKA